MTSFSYSKVPKEKVYPGSVFDWSRVILTLFKPTASKFETDLCGTRTQYPVSKIKYLIIS